MLGWLRKPNKSASEVLGQRVPIATSESALVAELRADLEQARARFDRLQAMDDERVAKLQKKLEAADARYNDLHARYATLFELNQLQANRITHLQGELAGVTGEPG